MRARNARPYNVAKKETTHCTAVPVGARIARPLFEFLQNFGFEIREEPNKTD